MLSYLLRRLGISLVILFGLSILVFLLVNLSGDPIRLLLPPDAPQSEVEAFRHARGFNDPLPVRYARFMGHLAKGDFGRSIQLDVPALELVLERLPATLSLALLAIAVAVLLGVPLGALAALQRNRPLDGIISTVAITGQSTPIFWLAIMGILLFAVELRWLPASGVGSWRHYVLPVGTLSLFLLGGIVRVTRTSMLEVLPAGYVRTARAKGALPATVVWRHAFRNAAIPVVTQISLQMRFVIGGSVITETIFAWPGLGRLLVRSVYARDYPVVEAGVFAVALLLIVINTLVDLSYAWLNPKVELR
jgi:ABC-type dipeptide/oligopeptide/nickel transport system permease component